MRQRFLSEGSEPQIRRRLKSSSLSWICMASLVQAVQVTVDRSSPLSDIKKVQSPELNGSLLQF